MFKDAEMSYEAGWVDVFYTKVGTSGKKDWATRTVRCYSDDPEHFLQNPSDDWKFDDDKYVERDGGVQARLRRMKALSHIESMSTTGTKWLKLHINFPPKPGSAAQSGYLHVKMKA